jgi:hypothetical protein
MSTPSSSTVGRSEPAGTRGALPPIARISIAAVAVETSRRCRGRDRHHRQPVQNGRQHRARLNTPVDAIRIC